MNVNEMQIKNLVNFVLMLRTKGFGQMWPLKILFILLFLGLVSQVTQDLRQMLYVK